MTVPAEPGGSASPLAAELDARYHESLSVLRKHAPQLHAGLKQYEPRALALDVSGGYADLVDRRTGAALYGSDPRAHAAEEVERYRSRPLHARLRTVPQKVLGEADSLHVANANRAIGLLSADAPEDLAALPATVDYILVLGLGLGHHVEALLASADVRHLCIVEPSADVLYASLHTFDWRGLFARFDRPGRSLELVLGADTDAAAVSMASHLDAIGPHNAVRPLVYEHASSATLAEVKRIFLDRVLPGRANHLGYYDDERVGFAHTVHNYTAEVPLLQDHFLRHHRWLDAPAFVVGNGPSLDGAVDFLRANRDRMVVFSCGTALGSLARAGIRPDFHVEMERSRPVVEWIEGGTRPDQRADVTLLALNTVHPEVFGLFDSAGMALKANDAGTAWVARHAGQGGSAIVLPHCNPTVGNCGLAFAAAFGFRDVYLVGLDLGFPAEGAHHSALSLHYRIGEAHHDDLGVYRTARDGNLLRPGNRGGEVVTNRVYVSAAQAIHRLVSSTAGLRVRNTSGGLMIAGTEPVDLSGVSLPECLSDRSALVGELMERHFGRTGLRSARRAQAGRVFRGVERLARSVREIVAREVSSREAGMAQLDEARARVVRARTDRDLREAAALLDGSVSHFALILAQALHRFEDPERALALHGDCREPFLELLDAVVAEARTAPLDTDTRTRGLDELLDAS